MRCLVLALMLLASPAFGDACEEQFRAGMAAGASVEQRLRGVEHRLYSGLGWISRSAVLRHLEGLSARTSACQEIAALRGELAETQRLAETAQTRFELAAALCWDVNRTRARRNLEALGDSTGAIRELNDYLTSLTTC